MMLSSALRRQTIKNLKFACKFSSSAIESPKITIAKNLLLLRNISEANDEESLQKVLSAPLPAIDVNNLPEELKDLEEYLVLGSGADDKYIPDPTAWQNKSGFGVAADEVQRSEVWPLIVGSIFTFWLLVVYPNDKIPESMKEKSDYLRFQRRLRGEDHGDNHSGSHH